MAEAMEITKSKKAMRRIHEYMAKTGPKIMTEGMMLLIKEGVAERGIIVPKNETTRFANVIGEILAIDATTENRLNFLADMLMNWSYRPIEKVIPVNVLICSEKPCVCVGSMTCLKPKKETAYAVQS